MGQTERPQIEASMRMCVHVLCVCVCVCVCAWVFVRAWENFCAALSFEYYFNQCKDLDVG